MKYLTDWLSDRDTPLGSCARAKYRLAQDDSDHGSQYIFL
jgi:hypothetical protein